MPRNTLAAILLALLGVVVSPGSGATTPIQNATGLSAPTSTITFSELVFPDGTIITNQFSGLGVTFSPLLRYNSQGVSGCCNGIVDNYVGNNGGEFINPFSILFSSDQTAAAFALATNPATTTFEALLNSLVVESFSSPTHFNSSTPVFFGFTGTTFDEIRVTVGGDQQGLIDNVQLGLSPVPEPTTLLLLTTTAAGLGYFARRRRNQ